MCVLFLAQFVRINMQHSSCDVRIIFLAAPYFLEGSIGQTIQCVTAD